MIIPVVNGPACPRCGCKHSEVVKIGEFLGRRSARRECRHCRCTWSVTLDPVPEESLPEKVMMLGEATDDHEIVSYSSRWIKCRCPQCGSKNPLVRSTQKTPVNTGTIRYHRCEKCGHNFKSIERPEATK